MRCPAIIAFVLTFAIGTAAAQSPNVSPPNVSADDRATIRRIIEDQLAAFQRDDAAAAFGFASPMIQGMFGTPENFIAMVQQGYQPVYRPRAVKFGDIVGEPGEPIQLVDLIGPNGEAVTAAYTMIQLADGTWRINGCVLLRQPQREV